MRRRPGTERLPGVESRLVRQGIDHVRVVVEGGPPMPVKARAGMEVRSGPSSDRRRPRGRRPGPPRETRGKRPNPGPNLGFSSSLFHGRIIVRMATTDGGMIHGFRCQNHE